jgi:hypothetical protein
MIKTIAILVASPLTEDIYLRIGVHFFEKKMNTIVLDCMEWLRDVGNSSASNYEFPNTVDIVNELSLEHFLSNNRIDFLIDFSGTHSSIKFIRDSCKRNNTLYIIHRLFPQPASKYDSNLIKGFLKRRFPYILKQLFILKSLILYRSIYTSDIALLVGSSSLDYITSRAKKIIFTTSPLWYETMKLDESPDLELEIPKEFFLFIDDCLALSVDFELTNQKAIIPSEKYFKMLNYFFDRIESRYQIPVVIAAHPNGKAIKDYQNYFNGRKVFFDSTVYLTSCSKLTFTHYSSAINYAVIFNKNVYLLNFSELEDSIFGRFVNGISEVLKCSIINIDQNLSIEDFKFSLDIDALPYERFFLGYISNEEKINRNGPFENLINYLLKL